MEVVVAGCGAAGAEFVRHFRGELAVVSPSSYLVCQALLPAYVAGKVEEDYLKVDLRSFFDKAGVAYYPYELSSVKLMCKTAFLKTKTQRGVKYSFAVIAIGGEECTYGISGIEKALSINTLESARKARKRLERARDVVVVGSGMTGVETAYEISDYCRVKLIEAADRILPAMCKKAAIAVEKLLKEAGVEILTSCRVESIGDTLQTSCGEVEFDEVVWCAGIKGKRLPGLKYGKSGIKVDEFLRAGENTFAIGDCAEVFDRTGLTLATKTALEAERQAKYVARLIKTGKMKAYRPFSTMKRPFAIMTFGKRAVLVKGNTVLTSPLLYRLKRLIVRRFLENFEV